MNLKVDPDSPLPIYYQIREQLRQQILSGHLKPGDPLPSEAQICALCGVSRMTARMALSQLAHEGLVVRRKGKGTFVAPQKATLPEDFIPMSYTTLIDHIGMRAGAIIRSQELLPAPPHCAQYPHQVFRAGSLPDFHAHGPSGRPFPGHRALSASTTGKPVRASRREP
ncbi:MAG: GntR family transcriptional regulator [Anaerolineae bacterium]|nr:GntR family transcriptional regulator [Anaerolineae bacterium]